MDLALIEQLLDSYDSHLEKIKQLEAEIEATRYAATQTWEDLEDALPGYVLDKSAGIWEITTYLPAEIMIRDQNPIRLLTHKLRRLEELMQQPEKWQKEIYELADEPSTIIYPCNTLGEMLDVVRSLPESIVYENIGLPESWRGNPKQLTFTGGQETIDNRALLLRLAECSVRTFTGYKGGNYTMRADTPIWADGYGRYEGIGIRVEGGTAGLVTEMQDV